VETSWFAIKEEFQQCLLCQKNLANLLLRYEAGYFGTLASKRTVQLTQLRLKDKLKPAIRNKQRRLLSETCLAP
jgi:hypothetical protein